MHGHTLQSLHLCSCWLLYVIANMSAAELYIHLTSRCWSNRSSGQTFPGVLSDFQHRLSGTRCHKQFWSAAFCLFLNLDLKLFYSLRLSLNTGPTCCQHLWSYDRMALCKFDYYYYKFIKKFKISHSDIVSDWCILMDCQLLYVFDGCLAILLLHTQRHWHKACGSNGRFMAWSHSCPTLTISKGMKFKTTTICLILSFDILASL